MKVLVINGNPESTSTSTFGEYLNRLTESLCERDFEVKSIPIADLKINYCIGCFNCWLKTPGQCVFRDDMELVLREMLKSDLVIYASPLSLGFLHHLLKKTLDRSIPLVLPYISIYKKEFHHYLRYPKMPLLGVLVEKEADTDGDDLELTYGMMKRLSLNMRTRLVLAETTEKSPEEVFHEISCI
jgi:hypothetical protein